MSSPQPSSHSIALRSPQPPLDQPPEIICSPPDQSSAGEFQTETTSSLPTQLLSRNEILSPANSTEGLRETALHSHPPSIQTLPTSQPQIQSHFQPSSQSLYTNPYFYTHTHPQATSFIASDSAQQPPPQYSQPPTPTSSSPARLSTAYAQPPPPPEAPPAAADGRPRSNTRTRGIPLSIKTSFSSLRDAGRKGSLHPDQSRGLPQPAVAGARRSGFFARMGTGRFAMWMCLAVLTVAAVVGLIVGLVLHV